MAANVLGCTLFVSQQVGWEEQRIQLKFSFHRKVYSDSVLNERSNDLFGTSWIERMLKNYNGEKDHSPKEGSHIEFTLSLAEGKKDILSSE